MTITRMKIPPLGNSGLANSSPYGGWDNSVVSLPEQKPIPQSGKEFTGINFLGNNGLSNIHNANVVKNSTPVMRTGTSPTFPTTAATASPLYLNRETFTDVWGGGGPLTGKFIMAV